jgi:hypothetical protein
MGTCAYCQQRKGKRSCPALQSSICSSCCGQHRLREIQCPSSCSWLGGLTIIQTSDPVLATNTLTYNALQAPEVEPWLSADEEQRIAAIESYHKTLKKHPPVKSQRVHAMSHLMVENQIALQLGGAVQAITRFLSLQDTLLTCPRSSDQKI